jgi:serine/threonine protein phosphatase PrpC
VNPVWAAAGATDVGRIRTGNEDAFRIDLEQGVFLVADGMGGHAAGEVASELTADVVAAETAAAVRRGSAGADLAASLHAAVLDAHAAIRDCCRTQPATRGMGTTLTALVVEPHGAAHAAHIGDSRLYKLRDSVLAQVTRDHTWVQREVEEGRIQPAAARTHPLSHILTQVLTDDIEPAVDSLSLAVAPGDVLLLATDGLYNMLPDGEIARILMRAEPLPERVRSLIEAANRAGGADNVTVVVIRFG